MTSFVVTKHGADGVLVRLDVAGEVRDADVVQLGGMILEAIVRERADEVVVNLAAVSFLDSLGVWALVRCYGEAIAYGSRYRVINARDQVRRLLSDDGVLEALADNEDIVSLMLAVPALPDGARP